MKSPFCTLSVDHHQIPKLFKPWPKTPLSQTFLACSPHFPNPKIYQKSKERRQKTTGSTAFLWWCLSDRREDCFWKHNSVTRTAVIILSPFLLLFAFWIYQPKLSIVRKKGDGHFQQVTLHCAYTYTNTQLIHEHEQLGLCFPYSRWYNCTRWLGIKKTSYSPNHTPQTITLPLKSTEWPLWKCQWRCPTPASLPAQW